MKLPPLTEEELNEFLKGKWTAKLATVGRDGTPRITPYWYEYRDDHILINTYERSETVGNLKRNRKAGLLIDSKEEPYRAVHFYGVADVEDRPSTAGEIAQLWSRYEGIEAATKLAQTVAAKSKRVFIHFYPERKVTFDYGKRWK
ncbi:MAG: pyridoxamine 5'-phosphate oxidase family protein [Thaumarchaeota archaeon]|nr:pyridoxamine 5'-phosphate oxidase family protein [Nitrososphaerota archaeon]